jgi:hypothetical protein
MSRYRAWCLALLLLIPTKPVTKHTSSNDTTSFAPLMRTVRDTVSCLFMREAIVVHAARLVREVLQTIPLRSSLSVDVKFVIVGTEIGKVCKVDLLLLELFAIESGELNVVELPVKLDVLSGANFFRRRFHDSRGEEVDSYRASDVRVVHDMRIILLPTSSFSPFLSKNPHILPCGIPSTFGRSSKAGNLYSCSVIVDAPMLLLL